MTTETIQRMKLFKGGNYMRKYLTSQLDLEMIHREWRVRPTGETADVTNTDYCQLWRLLLRRMPFFTFSLLAKNCYLKMGGKMPLVTGFFFATIVCKCWNEVFFKIMKKTSLVQKKTIPYMKAKLILIGKKTKNIFSWKTKKPKAQKIVTFQHHQYPIYHFGTIFKI